MMTLEQIQAKYPHVIEILDYTINEYQYSTERAMSELPATRMADRLVEKIEKDIISGKRTFRFYEIECDSCARTRVIKPQDAFQVKSCGKCK